MLHIILVILKIAGTLLAAVLLLLMLALLLLLFVPLRYEIAVRHTTDETFIRGRITWLLHLLRVKGSLESPGTFRISAKIFWLELFSRPTKPKSSRHRGRKKRPKTVKEEKNVLKSSSGIQDSKQADTSTPFMPTEEKIFFDGEAAREEDKAVSSSREEDRTNRMMISAVPMKERTEECEDGGEKRNRFLCILQRLVHLIQKFFERLYSIIPSVKAILSKLWNHLRDLVHTILDFKERADHYLEIWREKETRAFLQSCRGHIFYLLCHIRPRKVKGFLKYGFADPSVTGKITGILYMLRPLAFAKLELEPVFDTETLLLESDLYMKGHIRAAHLVRIGLKLLFDKNLKHLRQRLRE